MRIMIRETPDIAVVGETYALVEGPSSLRRAAVACGKLAALGTVMAGSAVAGLFMSSTETSIGPHEAKIELTLDGEATFDLGPIGSIIKPLENGEYIGAHITVGEVPIAEGKGFTVEDIEEYARSLSNFEGDIADMKSDLARQATRNALIGGMVACGLYWLPGPKRRQELINKFEYSHAKFAIAGMASLNILTATTLGFAATSSAGESSVAVSSVFEDTPLENTRVTGSFLPDIINEHGRAVLERLNENDEFYDTAVDNLQTAFAESPPLAPHPDYRIVVAYFDIHCNVGMARVVGEFARQEQADIIADGGDTTMGGTTYEEFCVQALANELPNEEKVVAQGNHDDSAITGEQMADNGYTVLNGEVVELESIRVLGDNDVMRSEFGETISQKGDESIEQLGVRLADTACADPEGVDILLVHEPEAAQASIDRGCVRTALSGHTHNESIQLHSTFSGKTIFQLVGDNASGTRRERPSLGPIETSATLYALMINVETGQPSFYQTVTIHPDASVTLGRPTAVSSLVPVQ